MISARRLIAYKRKSSLINHVRSHHSDINFPCDECGKRFKRKDLLQYHHKIHEAVKITCSHCDTSFSTKKSLNTHEMKFHSTGQIYQCKECFKSFSSKNIWNKHMLQCHSTNAGVDNVIICDQCKESFINHNLLKSHGCMSYLKEYMNNNGINNVRNKQLREEFCCHYT